AVTVTRERDFSTLVGDLLSAWWTAATEVLSSRAPVRGSGQRHSPQLMRSCDEPAPGQRPEVRRLRPPRSAGQHHLAGRAPGQRGAGRGGERRGRAAV